LLLDSCINLPVCYVFPSLFSLFVYQLAHLLRVPLTLLPFRVSTCPFVTRSPHSSPFSCINLPVCYAFPSLFALFVYQLARLLRVPLTLLPFRVSTCQFVTRSACSSPFSCVNLSVCYAFSSLFSLFVYQLAHLLRSSKKNTKKTAPAKIASAEKVKLLLFS